MTPKTPVDAEKIVKALKLADSIRVQHAGAYDFAVLALADALGCQHSQTISSRYEDCGHPFDFEVYCTRQPGPMCDEDGSPCHADGTPYPPCPKCSEIHVAIRTWRESRRKVAKKTVCKDGPR